MTPECPRCRTYFDKGLLDQAQYDLLVETNERIAVIADGPYPAYKADEHNTKHDAIDYVLMHAERIRRERDRITGMRILSMFGCEIVKDIVKDNVV